MSVEIKIDKIPYGEESAIKLYKMVRTHEPEPENGIAGSVQTIHLTHEDLRSVVFECQVALMEGDPEFMREVCGE